MCQPKNLVNCFNYWCFSIASDAWHWHAEPPRVTRHQLDFIQKKSQKTPFVLNLEIRRKCLLWHDLRVSIALRVIEKTRCFAENPYELWLIAVGALRLRGWSPSACYAPGPWHGDNGHALARAWSWNHHQTLTDCLCCHICCAHLGTSWNTILGASRAVSNRESRYPHPRILHILTISFQ